MIEFRGGAFNEFGSIDCEINHPSYGWIPFTASLNDVEPHGVAIYNSLKNTAEPYFDSVVSE